jgi:hypothetical protein
MVSILSAGDFVMLDKVDTHVGLWGYKLKGIVFSVSYCRNSMEADWGGRNSQLLQA